MPAPILWRRDTSLPILPLWYSNKNEDPLFNCQILSGLCPPNTLSLPVWLEPSWLPRTTNVATLSSIRSLFTVFEIVVFFLLGSEVSDALLPELLHEPLAILPSYLALLLHVRYYFLCLFLSVATSDEVNHVGNVVSEPC